MNTKKFFTALAALLLILVAGVTAADAASMPSRFPNFSTRDLSGRTVTNAIFAESEITMINFWATWCPPCIEEMPDLAEMYDALGEGLIGVLVDADDRGAIDRAHQILRTAGANFPQLLPSKDMDSVLNLIDAIPTSIFVDSNGNIVGSTVVGARSSREYMRLMLTALEEADKSNAAAAPRPAAPAPSQAVTVTILNESRETIVELFLSDANDSSWGGDLLEGNFIRPRDTAVVNLPARYREFDFMAVFEDGDTAEDFDVPGSALEATIVINRDGTVGFDFD